MIGTFQIGDTVLYEAELYRVFRITERWPGGHRMSHSGIFVSVIPYADSEKENVDIKVTCVRGDALAEHQQPCLLERLYRLRQPVVSPGRGLTWRQKLKYSWFGWPGGEEMMVWAGPRPRR